MKVDLIDEIIVATSSEKTDDIIYDYCVENSLICERGSKNNVLDRFVKVATKRNIDVIIRITGDNPIVLIDVLTNSIEKHLENGVDYTRNLNMPYGTSFEIINAEILEDVLNNKKITQVDKEHVTIFVKNNSYNYSVQELEHQLAPTDFRFTIDYPSDYAAMNILFQYLHSINYEYNYDTLHNFLLTHEWLHKININNYQKKDFKSLGEEISEAKKLLKSCGFEDVSNMF